MDLAPVTVRPQKRVAVRRTLNEVTTTLPPIQNLSSLNNSQKEDDDGDVLYDNELSG